MEERGPQRLLSLAYGNHPKSSKLKSEAVKILRALRGGPRTIEELAEVLGVDLNRAGGRKHFFLVMRRLRETGMVSVSRVEGKRRYQLSLDGFNVFWREVRKEAEYWLKPVEAQTF